jgi:hypothetical protein
MEKELFDDLVLSLNEAIEYEKGNLQLKTTVLEIPDEEIVFYNIYNKLSESNKQKAMKYVNELLHNSNI